ncbi:MAG: hypothetical protein A3F13_07855 [Gammaproteobacteria bacterium RIFCSPHIGHO2_12_FULL_40_19]|nr:MAG: hypothetical protein A3F13_07855 [Gammaproteobacteria bacterium RIFCSPHIGHO2_12_FULL_40_19]
MLDVLASTPALLFSFFTKNHLNIDVLRYSGNEARAVIHLPRYLTYKNYAMMFVNCQSDLQFTMIALRVAATERSGLFDDYSG